MLLVLIRPHNTGDSRLLAGFANEGYIGHHTYVGLVVGSALLDLETSDSGSAIKLNKDRTWAMIDYVNTPNGFSSGWRD